VAQLEAIVVVERTKREGRPVDVHNRRDFEIAESCREINSRERLKPVLDSFGIFPGEPPQRNLF